MLLQRRYVYIQMSVATDLHRFEQMKGILSFCLWVVHPVVSAINISPGNIIYQGCTEAGLHSDLLGWNNQAMYN